MSNNQESLFGDLDKYSWWDKEWQDMPEFHQLKQEPYANINIRFRNKEDLEEFAKLVDQNLNNKTKSMWYPKLEAKKLFKTRWIDES